MRPHAHCVGDKGVCAELRAGGRVRVVEHPSNPLALGCADLSLERGIEQRQLQAGGIGVLPGVAYRLCPSWGCRACRFFFECLDNGFQCVLVADDRCAGVVVGRARRHHIDQGQGQRESASLHLSGGLPITLPGLPVGLLENLPPGCVLQRLQALIHSPADIQDATQVRGSGNAFQHGWRRVRGRRGKHIVHPS